MCDRDLQPIYIECSSGLQSAYDAPSNWFTLISGINFLKILLTPEEYVPFRKGEAPQIIRSFSRATYPLKLREVGFVVTMQEDNIKLRYLLEEIADVIAGNSQEVKPTLVLDYLKPERQDYKIAIANNTEPYTARTGFIEVDPGAGTSGKGGDRYSINGIRFTFTQISLVK